jgi:transposase
MNIKIKLKNKHTIKQLENAIKESKDEGQKTRLRVLIDLKKGTPRTKIIKSFIIDYKTLLYWIDTYNKKGIDGLVMNKGGRPEGNPKWDKRIFEELTREIKKTRKYWSIPIMQEWIKKNKEKDIPEQTIWYHLKILGFSYTSLRPHPYKGDKETQKVFKKKGWKTA